MAETMMTTFNKKTDLKRIGIIPKSPNKILSNSLCRILDRILKLFIFNKIKRYRAIQRSDVLTFMKPI